jgi:transposase
LRWHGIVLLDNGMNCDEIAVVLLIYDDTVRRWYGLYGEAGLAGFARLGYGGR